MYFLVVIHQIRLVRCMSFSVCCPIAHGEAWTFSAHGDGKLCFLGGKSHSGEPDQDLGPWPPRWMRFIKKESQKTWGGGRPPAWVPVTRRFGGSVRRTRGVVGARRLQVALSAARRDDAVMGITRAKPNYHACERVRITVSGMALHQTKACMEVRGEGRAAGAGMWRQWILPCVRRLVFQAVVASMVAQRAQGAGCRGTDILPCFGTHWTCRPEEDTHSIGTATRGRVDASGRRSAARRR